MFRPDLRSDACVRFVLLYVRTQFLRHHGSDDCLLRGRRETTDPLNQQDVSVGGAARRTRTG